MSSSLRGRRILVVDDEPAIREALRARLEEEGAEVETGREAGGARARIAQGDYDLLLLEQRPPHAPGLELLEQLRQAGSTCAVVMMSAGSSAADTVRAMRSGAADCLLKPFALEEMVLVAERAVQAARPGRLLALPQGGLVLDDLIKDLLDQALEQCAGNKSRAAQLLGIHRDQVRYWVKKHGLTRWIRTRAKPSSREERGRE
ncbi:MAG: response regulator [Planctomycetes bacterium]|nr:response regulator [Planctomycetota bacterium]